MAGDMSGAGEACKICQQWATLGLKSLPKYERLGERLTVNIILRAVRDEIVLLGKICVTL
jgi:hypothetical protein